MRQLAGAVKTLVSARFWDLPEADPEKWWRTTKADAKAIRAHRWLWAVGIMLVVAASEILGFTTKIHGPTKAILIAISAGGGALLLIWIGSWVVAMPLARHRQFAAAIRERDKANENVKGQAEASKPLMKELGERRNEVARLTRERDEAIRARDEFSAQLRVLSDPTRIEGLRIALDQMVKRGFELYKELYTGAEPTKTDEEGRGIAYPFFPPDAKWERVYEFEHEARELIYECDPGLLFGYADSVNAAREKLRRRNEQRDKAQEKLPSAEQMRSMIDRLHNRPAEDLECYVNALADVKKEL